LLAVLAVAGGLVAFRGRAPALCAAAAAYAVIVAPVLGFSQSGPQLVADRYTYLAGMPLVLLAAGAVPALAARRPETVATVAVMLILASAAATWRQATFWRTSTTLWERAYALDPDNAGTLVSLGNLRAQEAQAQNDRRRGMALLTEALALHRRAFALDENPLMLQNMSQVETWMSLYDPDHAPEHHVRALEHAERALQLAREQNVMAPEYLLMYGTDLVNVGRVEEGIAQLEQFVRQQPDRLQGLVNLAGALSIAGRAEQAVSHLERACRLEPLDTRPWVGLARAYEKLGKKKEALAAWQRVLALSPSDGVAAAHVRALAMGQ
jgi:tetratricopeptide (TPR) repeat protein